MNRTILCWCAVLCGWIHATPPEQELVDALGSNRALQRGEGLFVRAAVAKHFEATQAKTLDAVFGKDRAEFTAWLSENQEFREQLFTAIDPTCDDVPAALAIIRALYKLGPAQLRAHPQLAIALAVVWDTPAAVYDHTVHAVRTKSTLPTGVKAANAVTNYKQWLAVEKDLPGPTLRLPWEFLTHIINHRSTPEERTWAVTRYGQRRKMIGEIYPTVEFDVNMLRTRSAVCRLAGHNYDLPSILKYGGVCAMQADFAARVGKCVLIPSEFIVGESAGGEYHAWVMWAEVRAITASGKIDFTLQREGAYHIDNYYVGLMQDPHTNRATTDRDTIRRLVVLGGEPDDARHAALLMRHYPLLAKWNRWTIEQKLRFIDGAFDLCPSDERAWLELAKLSRTGEYRDAVPARETAIRAFGTFAKHPDFSWQLLPALLHAIPAHDDRVALYEKALRAYELLGRPDLACEVRLALSALQVGVKEYRIAADGLASTIRRFPEEGRYVPKMMTELVALCKQFDGGTELLARFYLAILPKVPGTRGNAVTKYAVAFHEQAIAFYTQAKKPAEAEKVRGMLRVLVTPQR